jgi:hypothetical protein
MCPSMSLPSYPELIGMDPASPALKGGEPDSEKNYLLLFPCTKGGRKKVKKGLTKNYR